MQLLNQEYWEISGLEVTNFRSDDPASTNDMSGSVRMGILIFNSDQENVKHGFVVRDCYIHDVVSSSKANTDEINYKMASAVIALGHYRDIKGNQLIAPTEVKASFDGVLFENNIVSNVSREGIRTHVDGIWGDYRKNMKDVVIRGNYIENVFGDGIVLSAVKEGGVVERNVVKNPCNKNTDGAYYAGAWAHWSDNALFQYNYSHDNNGGACLFMGGAAPKNGQHNTVFRYNVSANDGWRNQEILNDHTNDANDDGRTAADAADIIADPLAQLRERVSVFAPQEGSPAVCAGVKIEGNSLTEDIMGSPISETPTIGAIEYVEPEEPDKEEPDKNKPSDSGKASDVPKTGDSGTETAALYIAAVAAAAGAVTLRRKKSV